MSAGRTLLGSSQAELAAAAKVGRLAVQRYESGEVTPRAETMAKLVEALRAAGVETIRRRDGAVGVVIRRDALAARRDAAATDTHKEDGAGE